jgi:hypothetical protein
VDSNFNFTTGTVGPFSLGAGEYLYVEYFTNVTTISASGPSAEYTSTFRTGPTYSDPRIVTPSISIPENVVYLLAVSPLIPFMVIWLRKNQGSHRRLEIDA